MQISNQIQERQNINDDQQNIRWVDVPGDGSCLFWSTALAYLIPVKDNDNLFAERYERLFGNGVPQHLEDVRSLIRNNNVDDNMLAGLIRHNFRNRVVDYIRDHENQFRGFIEGNFQNYLRDMRNPNNWGDEPEIRAMSEMLSANIIVHSGGEVIPHDFGDVQINLLHTGPQGQRNHYKFGLDRNLLDPNAVKSLEESLNKYHHFELIQLLIEELDFTETSNIGKQRGDFDSFQARFQSFIDQIPSYLHSVKKDGFFTHFFLGSFSVVLDTKIAEKLDVKKIYFSFGSAKTLKLAVMKGEINNLEDVIKKVKLLVISEKQEKNPNTKSRGDDPDRKFRGKELINLWDTPPSYIDDEAIREIENKMKVKLVEIKKSSEEISVNVEDENMGYGEDEKKVYKFKEIKRGLWNKPEDDIANLSNPNRNRVLTYYQGLLNEISKIHREYKSSLYSAIRAREAADHGFISGVFMNFRYRYNLRIYLEQFAGRGYADIILLARGPDRSTNSIPIIIEVKAGGSSVSAPDRALRQAETYARGFQPNVMRVLTTADSILYVGVNFDHASPVSEVQSLDRDMEIVPIFEDILVSSNRWCQMRSSYHELEHRIRDNLQRIHHTFPGTAEKSDNHYFSRYLLGQLLLLDRVDALDTGFDKHIFSYNEVVPTETHPTSGREQRPAAQVSRERMSAGLDSSHAIVTIVLIPRSAEKLVYVINIGEANRKVVGEEIVRVPLENLGRQIENRKIFTLDLNFNLHLTGKARGSGIHVYVEPNYYSSLSDYNNRVNVALRGDFVHLPYHRELREAFDRALDYRGSSAESLELSQPSTIDRYRGLLQRVGVEIFPFRSQINSESNFQAVLHGVFSHYSDLKLNESPENRLLVLTEFQTGRGDRIDMLIQRVKFSGQNEEYTPIGLELKISRDARNVQAALREAEDDINKYYKKGVTYKTLTDGSEVKFIAVAFNRGASNENSPLILTSSNEITVTVVHSSILELDIQRSCSRGGRGKRNVAMPCVDSRSEKEIIEQKRDIQKLVDDKVIKKINLKRLEMEVSNRYEEIIDDIQSINKMEILNNAVKSVEFAKILSLDQDNKILQKKAYYNALMDLGALLCDYTDHMYGYRDRSSALRERIKNNELFSTAYDLYLLSKNEDSAPLYSSKDLKNYNTLEFDTAWLSDYFRNSNLEDFQKAYNEDVIILSSWVQVHNNERDVYIYKCIHTQTKDIYEKLVIGNYESIRNPENYLLDEETSEIKIISENEEYNLLTGIQGENTRHYFALDYGYKAEVADVIGGFYNKKAIHDKLHTLELLASKKEIEEIADSKITDSDYDNTIDVLKEEMLKRGITEEHFNKLKDNLNEEIFIKYIDTIENGLVKHNTEFNSDKFKLAKANSIKGGKLLSLMAIYDLLDSVRDVSTLGRHDNSVLKRVFGVNGILDAVNDVRESISTSYVHGNSVKTKISPDSIVGRIVSKIPGSVRKNLVKIIDNPAVQSITFVTIAYQFGHSVKEIVGGNHHPLNYYWTGSSSIKLASMSIRPISIGVSAVSGRFIRALSVAGKLLGKLSIATGIVDITITAAIDMYQAKEYIDEISSHIPLSVPERYNLFREKSWFADLYSSCTLIGSITTDIINSKYENMFLSCFSMLKRLFTDRNTLSQSYEDAIKVKNQLSITKEQAIAKLIDRSDLRAIVQYTANIVRKKHKVFTGEIETKNEYSTFFVHPYYACTTKIEYGNTYYFDVNDEAAASLSSLNISDTLPVVFYTLNGVGAYVNKEHKHIPHLTVKEYENGYRIVEAPQTFKRQNKCDQFHHRFKRSSISNGISLTNKTALDYKDEHKEPLCIKGKVGEICRENFPPYKIFERKVIESQDKIFERKKAPDSQKIPIVRLAGVFVPYEKPKPYCPKGRVDEVCTETFDTSNEPFIIANDLRKRGDILYSLVPRNFTAAENYPAVIVLPQGEVNCIGSKNHETVFLINQSSGNLEGGIGEKNTVVIDSDESIKAELDRGILEYSKNKINLKNIYNLIVNSSGGYNITTHCNTKFISTNGISDLNVVRQGQSKCSIMDYELREVSSKSSHFRGMKQTTFIISKDSHEAMIFSPKEMHNKRNIDVISVKSNIAGSGKNKDINVTIFPTVSSNKGKYDIEVAILKIRKDVLSANYVLDLLDNHEKIISSIYIESVENLQVEKDGYYYKVDVDAMKLERILPAFEDVVMDYPTSLTRYQPDREYGLQIYRDRDSNIGLVDLRDKSIVDFNMEIVGDGLILLYRSNPFVKIENWNIDLSTRRMILIFSDAQIFDPNCMSSNCDPRGIVKRFNQVLEFLKNNPNTQKEVFSSEIVCKTIKESIPCGWLEGPFTSKCEPTGVLSGYYHVVEREECAPEVLSKNEIYLNQTRKIAKRSTRQFVTSSASRPTSFINTIVNTFSNAVIGAMKSVSNFISFKPPVNHSSHQPYIQASDINSTLLLLDVFIRRITGQKYISTVDQSISTLEAQGYALNITNEFEKVVEQAGLESGVLMHRLNINFVEIQKEVKGKIMSGKFNEISGVLKSYVEKGCPGKESGKLSPRKFDKFIAQLDKGLLNQSIEQILHNGDGRLEVDGVEEQKTNSGPQSYLSNASIQGHLTQAKRGYNLIP